MRSASALPVPNWSKAPARRRAATMTLVILLHLLVVFLLTRLADVPQRPPPGGFKPLTVELLPEEKAEQRAAAHKTQAKRAERSTSHAPAPPPPKSHVDTTINPPVAPSDAWSQVIPLTHEQLAAADISKMPSHAAEQASADDGEGGARSGGSGGSAGQPGAGPHGETLYDADWQRRPTQAELATYLPRNAPRLGWGMVACQTAPGFRVENCMELGQSPQGSGFSRAVREAAWQFRVMPPRIGGKALIGAWVRIRIDYTENGVK